MATPDIPDLLERESELAQLEAVIASARSGSGGSVSIQGPAGIGKTSLLRAARETAAAAGMRVLGARGSDLESELSYGVVRQLFEPALARAGPQGRRRLLAGAAGLAQPAFAVGGPDAPARADRAFSLLHGLYWLTANFAGRRPVLLAVDDVHWADVPSQRFLAYLTARIEDLPVAAVLALRTDEPAARREQLRHVAAAHAIEPAPLSEDAVAALTRRILGPSAAEEFCRACHTTTAGNPLYVRALLAELAAGGIEPTAEAAGHVLDLAPATVSHAVLVRLARLPPSALTLASSLAILGGHASLPDAAYLAGLSRSDAYEAADALRRAGIVEPGRPLSFVHPIVRAAVYSELAEGDRESGHLRAARRLEAQGLPPEVVAAHLLPLEPRGDGWVVETLCRAADAARARAALESEASYLVRALAEPPRERARPGVLLALGVAQAHLGRAEAEPHLREALACATSAGERALAARALMGLLGVAGRVEEAAQVVDTTIAAVEREDPAAGRMLEVELLSYLHQSGPAARQVPGRLERLVRSGRRRTAADRLLHAELAWQSVLRGDSVSETVRLARRALAAVQLLDSPFDNPLAYQVAYTLVLCDRFELADSLLTAAIADAQAAGSLRAFGVASVWRSHLSFRRGDVRGAEADARASLDASREHGWVLGRAWSLAFLIDALVELGELTHAEEALEQDSAQGSLPEGLPFNHLLESRAALRLARGRPAEALEDLAAFRRRERWERARNPACSAHRSSAALALALLGKRESALRLTRTELALARRFAAPRAVGVALSRHGLVLGGRRGRDCLAEATAVLERSGARLEHARALVELGAAVRRAGHRSDARVLLRRGAEAAESCGAVALRDRARHELRIAGGRSRPREAADRDELTPSEHRIAELVSRGLSNREVAQSLFLSLKTVEMHLSHAYRKLGVRSRMQLRDALG